MSAMDAGLRELLSRAGQRILERFGHDDNVTGVAVGYRRRAGKAVDEPVVTVMVKKKRRASLVSRRRLIPARIDVDGTSCATDVIQAQAVLLSADDTPPTYPDMFRPLQFGASIANSSDARPDAGTLGAFVTDNTDGTLGFISANHVIADNNTAPASDPILQPAPMDEPDGLQLRVATLKRHVPIVGGATAVDAAIAQLNRTVRTLGTYGGISLDPPSRYRPAVGMVVAGDGFGNVWLARMSTALTALNVTLMPNTGDNVLTTQPALNTKLEKVGRTSGKTVGRVLATGQSIDVDVPGQGIVRYTDLIWTQWMGWNGDSGAMVMQRRADAQSDRPDSDELQAREWISRLIRGHFDPCEVLTAMQYAYDVPITDDEALSDDVRDQFMAQSDTGRFLISLTYLNSELVRDRLETPQDRGHRAQMQAFYNEYQPVIADVMANPSSTRVITQADGEAYDMMLSTLASGGVLTTSEQAIARNLLNQHQGMQGMNRTAVIDYMNTAYCLTSIRTAATQMRSLRLWGTARTLGAVD